MQFSQQHLPSFIFPKKIKLGFGLINFKKVLASVIRTKPSPIGLNLTLISILGKIEISALEKFHLNYDLNV